MSLSLIIFSITGRVLYEIVLNESIRYQNGDKVEDWLNRLLCLDVSTPPANPREFPSPSDCKLYPFSNDCDSVYLYLSSLLHFICKFVQIWQ